MWKSPAATLLFGSFSTLVGCGASSGGSSAENLHLASDMGGTAFSVKRVTAPRDGDYTIRELLDDSHPIAGMPVGHLQKGQALGLSCDDKAQLEATVDGKLFASLHDDGDVGWVRILTPAEDRKLTADTTVGNVLRTTIELAILPIAPFYILTVAIISPGSHEHAMVFGTPAEQGSH